MWQETALLRPHAEHLDMKLRARLDRAWARRDSSTVTGRRTARARSEHAVEQLISGHLPIMGWWGLLLIALVRLCAALAFDLYCDPLPGLQSLSMSGMQGARLLYGKEQHQGSLVSCIS